MAPLWYTGFTLVLLVQITVGVNPLDLIIGTIVEKVLHGVEARLAQQEHIFVEQIEAMEVRLVAKIDVQETSLVENMAKMEARFAGHTVELDRRLAQYNSGMEVALERLEEKMTNETHRVAENTEARFNTHLTETNNTIGALLFGMKESITNECRYISNTTDTQLREILVRSTTSESLLRESLDISNNTETLLRESLVQCNTAESLLRESLNYSNSTESLLRESLVHSNTIRSMMEESLIHYNTTDALLRESTVHYNQTSSRLLLDLKETMVVVSRKLAKTTEIQLKVNLAQTNSTVGYLLHGLEARLTALCVAQDTHAPVTSINNSSNAQLQILKPLKSRVEITFLRRVNGSVSFTRDWNNYKSGFGDDSEFWLGLEALHQLTTRDRYGLRVDMEDWSGARNWTQYQLFKVGNEKGNYVLTVSGFDANSTAGNSMATHNRQPFSTNDRDNDRWTRASCADQYLSGWWYNLCYRTLPTAPYKPAAYDGEEGISWYTAYSDWRSFKYMTLTLVQL